MSQSTTIKLNKMTYISILYMQQSAITSMLCYSASTFKRQRTFGSSEPNLILRASNVLASIALFIFYVAVANIDPDLSLNMGKMPISWSLIPSTFSFCFTLCI